MLFEDHDFETWQAKLKKSTSTILFWLTCLQCDNEIKPSECHNSPPTVVHSSYPPSSDCLFTQGLLQAFMAITWMISGLSRSHRNNGPTTVIQNLHQIHACSLHTWWCPHTGPALLKTSQQPRNAIITKHPERTLRTDLFPKMSTSVLCCSKTPGTRPFHLN